MSDRLEVFAIAFNFVFKTHNGFELDFDESGKATLPSGRNLWLDVEDVPGLVLGGFGKLAGRYSYACISVASMSRDGRI